MFNKKILSYGITGKFGKIHSKISIIYETKIVCGVSNNNNGGVIYKIPVFSSSFKSIKITKSKICVIYVPFLFCKNIILENIFCGIKIIICITENISFFDILKIKYFCYLYKIIFIGPNSPGICIPYLKIRIGIFPIKHLKKGKLGIISKSGTLTYEAIKISYKKKIGQSICIGIGGDLLPLINYNFLLKIFLKDEKTKIILIIGEIGGNIELFFFKVKKKKKIFFYLVGVFSPLEKKMGHAGAINNTLNDILIKIKKIKKKFLVLNSLNDLNFIL